MELELENLHGTLNHFINVRLLLLNEYLDVVYNFF